jgi:hypothetical protein
MQGRLNYICPEMNHLKRQLINISKTLLQTLHPEEEANAARRLSGFFVDIRTQNTAHFNPHGKEETHTSSGIALSPFHAALCIHEHLRTTRFIKGVWYAIEELLVRFPKERITILYAGCGPYATLLLPLLPLLDSFRVQVMLLDLHEESLGHVQELISQLELDAYVSEIVKADASTFKRKPADTWHMVVTETMFEALTRETQVAITANLAPQLVSGGILIPEEIRLDLVCTTFVKERFWKEETDSSFNIFKVAPLRLPIGTLFSLTKNTYSSIFKNKTPLIFESPYFNIPEEWKSTPDLCILTHVRIFKEQYLESGTSSITNPHCITSLYNLTDKKQIRLSCNFSNIPLWKYK